MPRHGTRVPDLTAEERSATKQAARALLRVIDRSAGAATVEERLQTLLMIVGGEVTEDYLEELAGEGPFEEDGILWKVAYRGKKKLMSSFGWVEVERPLFRSKRNGPTRCLVSERAGLFQGKWTPRAAKLAAHVTAELPFGRGEELFRAIGAMAPSSTLLQRLDRNLLELWERDRQKHEEKIRKASLIPRKAVFAVVSLDGVMVHTVGSDRAGKVARTKAQGRAARGPAGYKEAAIGVVSLYDSAGDRLATWRMGRMPEVHKETVRAWLQAEVGWLRKQRPALKIVAAADAAAGNWEILESLAPDVEVVDYFHTVEYLARHLNLANGASTLDTQEKLREAKRLLLEEPNGAVKVFADLDRMREQAGTLPPSMKRTKGKRQPTFFQRHRDRLDYGALREQGIPIGTGVTEGTCRYLVVDRLRRSGMTWSESGGQAVLNLRSLLVSQRFEAGWACLVSANARWIRRAA